MTKPQTPPEFIPMSADEAKFVSGAAKEWKAIRAGRDWKSYMLIGAALSIGRRLVLTSLRINDIQSPVYKRAFAEWCQSSGFSGMEPTLRSDLLFLQEPENRVLCDELRSMMGDAERRRVNHPTAMVRRVRAYKRERDGVAKVRKPTAKDYQIDRLRDLVASMEGRDTDPAAIAVHHVRALSLAGLARLLCQAREPGEIAGLIEALQAVGRDGAAFDDAAAAGSDSDSE
jgi:hypothetical protein